MDEYDLNKAVRLINYFVNEDLSNWYIRRNRRRFWESEMTTSKKAVYQTTYEVLVGICLLIAPIVPFVADEIYVNLTGEESVHLADYPKYDEKMIQEGIEKKMDLVRELISLGRNAREEAKIKVRQPLSEVILDGKNEELIKDLVQLIKEELNVKTVTFASDLSIYMNFEVKPNFKICGKMFGPHIKEFQQKLTTLSDEDIATLNENGSIKMEIDHEEVEVVSEMVEIRISSKEGFNASHEGNQFIVLNTTLTEELLHEGVVRELISKVQNLRKAKDFDISDRIHLYYQASDNFEKAIRDFKALIQEETLAISMESKENSGEVYSLNGIDVQLDIEKVSK